MTIDKRAIAEGMKTMGTADADNPKAWAWRLKAREESGERLTKAQREMWRYAIRSEIASAEAEQ